MLKYFDFVQVTTLRWSALHGFGFSSVRRQVGARKIELGPGDLELEVCELVSTTCTGLLYKYFGGRAQLRIVEA